MTVTVGVPEIGVYAAFGNKPTDASFSFDTAVTEYVRDMRYRRGRTAVLNQIETGSGDATIDDSSRRFDPNNAASPYYPNVQPMKPIQARAALAIPIDGLLTASGNEVTDAVRAADALLGITASGNMCDGLTNDSSFGIRRAATNLFRRGQCDSTADSGGSAGVTLSTDATVPAPFSPQSIKVVTDGLSANQGVQHLSATGQAAAATTLNACSVYAALTPGNSYRVFARWVNTDASTTDGAVTTFTSGSGGWKSVVIGGVTYELLIPATLAVAAGKTGDSLRIVVQVNGIRAETFHVAHAMLEKGVNYVAPYVATSGGATATHPAARVRADASLLSSAQGWMAIRVRMGYPSSASLHVSEAPCVMILSDGSNNNRIGLYNTGAQTQWQTRRVAGGVLGNSATVTDSAWSAGAFRTLIMRWDATKIGVSVAGAAFVDAVNGQTFTPTSLDIGQAFGTGNFSEDDVLWFACGKGTLTDADAATLNGYGNTPPDASALLWPPLARPTMVWHAATSACRVATDAYLFTQFVARWPRKRISRNYAERGITMVDGFDLLSLAGVGGKTYTAQQSGAMISAILNDANWPSTLRSIAAGDSAIATQTFSSSDTTKALSLLQAIVGAGGENSLFFINGRGYVVFLGRHAQFGPPYNTSQATFTDVVTMAGEFPVTDIVPSSDKDLIADDWSGTRPGGATQQAIDSTSILNYGRRSKQVTSLLTTDADTLGSMQFSLSIYKNPLQRIESITIKPGNYAELWIQCLSREIGDRITVKEHPPGGGQADIRDYIIQSIDATFPAGPVGGAVYKWGLFPANSSVFLLDDLVNGRLDRSGLGN